MAKITLEITQETLDRLSSYVDRIYLKGGKTNDDAVLNAIMDKIDFVERMIKAGNEKD